MLICQWLNEVIWPVLKQAGQMLYTKMKENRASATYLKNDLTSPLHPLNAEQQAMSDYNDRRVQESLYNHLQDSQRYHGHDYYH